MYVCVCMCVYVCVFMYVCVCMCVYTYILSLFPPLPIRLLSLFSPHVSKNIECARALERERWGRGGASMPVKHAHTQVSTHINTYTCAHAHAHTHVRTHIHTHTGMQVLLLKHRKHETFRLRFLSGHARVSLLSASASLPVCVYLRVTHTRGCVRVYLRVTHTQPPETQNP